LKGVSFHIVALQDSLLGATDQKTILIDPNAQGYGWYLDVSPGTTGVFTQVVAANEIQAQVGSPAYGHVDLLTVVTHELGHVLGFASIDPSIQPDDWMTATLGTGLRRFPDEAPGSIGNAFAITATGPGVVSSELSAKIPADLLTPSISFNLNSDGLTVTGVGLGTNGATVSATASASRSDIQNGHAATPLPSHEPIVVAASPSTGRQLFLPGFFWESPVDLSRRDEQHAENVITTAQRQWQSLATEGGFRYLPDWVWATTAEQMGVEGAANKALSSYTMFDRVGFQGTEENGDLATYLASLPGSDEWGAALAESNTAMKGRDNPRLLRSPAIRSDLVADFWEKLLHSTDDGNRSEVLVSLETGDQKEPNNAV
jgi:hypothetical protein